MPVLKEVSREFKKPDRGSDQENRVNLYPAIPDQQTNQTFLRIAVQIIIKVFCTQEPGGEIFLILRVRVSPGGKYFPKSRYRFPIPAEKAFRQAGFSEQEKNLTA